MSVHLVGAGCSRVQVRSESGKSGAHVRLFGVPRRLVLEFEVRQKTKHEMKLHASNGENKVRPFASSTGAPCVFLGFYINKTQNLAQITLNNPKSGV